MAPVVTPLSMGDRSSCRPTDVDVLGTGFGVHSSRQEKGDVLDVLNVAVFRLAIDRHFAVQESQISMHHAFDLPVLARLLERQHHSAPTMTAHRLGGLGGIAFRRSLHAGVCVQAFSQRDHRHIGRPPRPRQRSVRRRVGRTGL